MNKRINIWDLKSQITKHVGPDCAQRYFGYLNGLLSQKLSKHDFDRLCVLTLGRENLPLHNLLIRAIVKNACQAKTPPPKIVQKNVFSNGDILPSSPKRYRSNGRISEFLPRRNVLIVRENGDLGLCDLKRPVQDQEDQPAEQPVKRSRVVKLFDVDAEREDFEQRNNLKTATKVPIQAPLGIPFYLPRVGGARRPLTSTAGTGFGNFISSFESGELCHSEDLRRRMEKLSGSQGLGGVAVDCANLLNMGLDAYLKRLIGSCSELVGAMKNRRPISLRDFRVAMELNPGQLGEDWALLLEKICLCSFEE